MARIAHDADDNVHSILLAMIGTSGNHEVDRHVASLEDDPG